MWLTTRNTAIASTTGNKTCTGKTIIIDLAYSLVHMYMHGFYLAKRKIKQLFMQIIYIHNDRWPSLLLHSATLSSICLCLSLCVEKCNKNIFWSHIIVSRVWFILKYLNEIVNDRHRTTIYKYDVYKIESVWL